MDSLSSLLDFTKICRLCLSQDRSLSNIFLDNIYQQLPAAMPSVAVASKILACVAIEVEPGDNLPDKICNRCTEQIENWIKFKELCDNANMLLLQCTTGMVPLSDEVLKRNLQGCNSEHLNIPGTSPDFCFDDVSLLEHDSLFDDPREEGLPSTDDPREEGLPSTDDPREEGLPSTDDPREEGLPSTDDPREEGLPSTEPFVNNSFSMILNDNLKALLSDAESKKQAEEEAIQESNRCKWREKYSRIYRKKYDCGVCPKIFTKFSSLLEHDRVNHREVVPGELCGKCGKTFISKPRLEIHENMKHRDKVYECDICGLKSASEKSLKVHKVRHSKRFVCGECGAVANTERSLQDHRRSHSDKRSYTCYICQRTFKHCQTLQYHLKTHTHSEHNFITCHICSRAFKTMRHLRQHKTSHVKENSAVCEICGAIFKNKTTLNIHRLSHKEKQHTCLVCDKMFYTKNLLTRHMLIHGERCFVCTVCDKDFNRADTLSLHLKSHSVSQLLYCNQCCQSFTLNKYLKRHMSRIHNKEGNT